MSGQLNLSSGFQPTSDNAEKLMKWFSVYDSLVLKNQLDDMADMALFPLTVVTDDSGGECVTQDWDRDTFKQAMDLAAQGVDVTTLKIENKRHTVFLSESLAVVITDSVTTIADTKQESRYVDVMVKSNGNWKYKMMLQTGWGDMLKQYFGA